MKKIIISSALVLSMAAITSTISPAVFAHVTVKPTQVGVGAYQTFTTGVPNEKDIPTTAIKIVVPEGFTSVTPNVKPGWTIETKKVKSGGTEQVSEIIWSGGVIPAGQRDDFVFSAKAPATEKTLQWKAYQTYQNGTVVAWDQDPAEHERIEKEAADKAAKGETVEEENPNIGPASETKVVNDLTDNSAASALQLQSPGADKSSQLMAGIALIASFAALAMGLRKK